MPIILVVCFTFLFRSLGTSMLAGIGVFVLAFVVNVFVGLKLETIN